jgi:MobA/MobL family
MAIPYFTLKTATRSGGRSALSHFLYIAREGRYAKDKQDLMYVEHKNYPPFGLDPIVFWEGADLYEGENRRLYTEFEIALPRELTTEQHIELVREFAEQQLGKRHPYTLVIHCPKALDGGDNPHAHVMFSERQLDGIERPQEQFFKRANTKEPRKGGAKKNGDWNRQDKISELCCAWEQLCNYELQAEGQQVQIDMRSLKAQGIERTPEPKLGATATAMLKNGEVTPTAEVVLAIRALKVVEQDISVGKKELAHAEEDLQHLRWMQPPAIAEVKACEVLQLVKSHKLELYRQLTETEQERYKLGFIWNPLSKTGGAYTPALEEHEIRKLAAQQVRSMELDPEAAALTFQKLTADLLNAEQQKEHVREVVEQRYEDLYQAIKDARKYELELKRLGDTTLQLKEDFSWTSRDAIADRERYQQLLDCTLQEQVEPEPELSFDPSERRSNVGIDPT